MSKLVSPTIPSEVDAEIALIGSIFLDQNVLIQTADTLEPSQFYDYKNNLIYKAMTELYRNGQAVDATTVIAYLTQNNLLEQSGGLDYILEISERSYSTANVDTYIQLIEESALKRRAIATLNDLSQAGYDPNAKVEDYIDYVEKVVFDLSKGRRVESFRTVADVTKHVMELTNYNSNRTTNVIGLDTGFHRLNELTQGFQNGALLILAARPAMGKSAMALNLAYNVCKKNNNGNGKVAIFSLEMPAEQLVQRMLASDSQIHLSRLISGKLAQSDWSRYNTSCYALSQLNLYFDDSPGPTIAKIKAKCRKLKAESGLDFVVIDYLQLIESEPALAKASQQEKVSRITRSLKLMARELEIPVLALSQLSREVEKRDEKKPNLSDLRDSGSIEQDADIVMFIYRDDYYNKSSERKGEADLIIAKNRSGATGEMPFMFAGEYQSFKEKKDEDY